MTKKIVTVLAVVGILLFGFYLRYQHYTTVPFPGQTFDEYSFSWVGLSLIRAGYPIGISGIGGYQKTVDAYINVDRVYQNGTNSSPQKINYPWFDHPPLLGLLTGGFAYVKGARVFEDASVVLIRKPMVALGTLSVLLVILVGFKLGGSWAGLTAGLIFATSPLVVVSSRMVQAENLLVFWCLAAVWFTLKFFDSGKERFLWFAALCGGAAIWTKLSGGFVMILLMLIVLFDPASKWKSNLKRALIPLIVGLSFLSWFIIYGLIFDASTFQQVLAANGNRLYNLGANAWWSLLTSTRITGTKFLTDGWILVGWISVLGLIYRQTTYKEKIIAVWALVYLAVYFFFGSENYGWYHIPFYPALCLATGMVIAHSISGKTSILAIVLALLIPLGVNLDKILNLTQYREASGLWRIVIPLLIVLGLINYLSNSNKAIKRIGVVVMVVFFFIVIATSVKYLAIITPDYWYHAT